VPILNYTTTVDQAKTVTQIQHILGSKGAKKVMTEYDSGNVTAITFALEVNGTEVYFKLPCNPEGVLRAMHKQHVPFRYRNKEHATRVSWRILKDWVEAQMAIVEAEQAEMAEVFLPYDIVNHQSGQTLFQRVKKSPQMLTAGGDDGDGDDGV